LLEDEELADELGEVLGDVLANLIEDALAVDEGEVDAELLEEDDEQPLLDPLAFCELSSVGFAAGIGASFLPSEQPKIITPAEIAANVTFQKLSL